MRKFTVSSSIGSAASTRSEQASARIILLMLVAFVLGASASGFWLYQRNRKPVAETENPATAPALSETTRSVLGRLQAPVEIRFYALLDPATLPETWKAFAGRADQLLSAYEQAAGGKIKLTRIIEPSDKTASAATADGLQSFNVDKGDACFLGVALAQGTQKESLTQLSPQWEPALEADLTRAIQRLGQPKPGSVVEEPKADPAAITAVKEALPNLGSVSLEEGAASLRQAAIEEFKVATKQMETELKEAQQQLAEAQKGQSAEEQQAALKHLQQVQAQQAERLKEIAANSKAKLDALRQLKKN